MGWLLSGTTLVAQDTTIDSLIHSDTTIYKVVEFMPLFWGCEYMEGTPQEKKACADQALIKYIHVNMKWPNTGGIEYQVEGLIVVRFVIEKDGSISGIKVLRDPGGGLGFAACEVLHLMQQSPDRWTPGQQNGQLVRVEYLVPIRIRLH